MRPLAADTAELKRLWVQPGARGSGAGRALVRRAVEEARAAGYRRIVLDSVPGQEAAQALYRSLGFADAAPYRNNPLEGTVYLELRLGP